MDWWSGQLMIALGLPVLGAALGMIWWSKPQVFKNWSLLVITLTWLMVMVPFWMTASSFTLSLFLMNVILAAGFITILGHHPNPETSVSLSLTLLFLGMGLGFVASQEPAGTILLSGIFALLILSLVRHRRGDSTIPWKAISILTIGLLSLLVSLGASGHLVILTLLIPLAIVWPLLPVQGAFVATIDCLPGMLPPFVSVLLPTLGFQGILTLLPVIPEGLFNLLWLLAIATALYGSLLALSQDSMERLLAYAHMALGGILWWYVAITQSIVPGAVVYVVALSLVMCGLLLAHHHIRARFGHLDLNLSHGLGHIMPWFSTLFVLLITAAVGLPLFTLFSAFMDMMLGFSSTRTGTLVVILLTWLAASWYFPKLMQQVLFGRPSPLYRPGRDLFLDERAALLFLLTLLVIIGVVPASWFGMPDPVAAIGQSSVSFLQDE